MSEYKEGVVKGAEASRIMAFVLLDMVGAQCVQLRGQHVFEPSRTWGKEVFWGVRGRRSSRAGQIVQFATNGTPPSPNSSVPDFRYLLEIAIR